MSVYRLFKILPIAVVACALSLPEGAALAQSSKTERSAWLGVSIQDITEDLSQSLPRGVHEGAIINGVIEGSPAEQAGLKEGDVVVKVDQTRIRNSGDLTGVILASTAGHVAVIEYYRDGQRMRAEAKLTDQTDSSVPKRREGGRSYQNRHPMGEDPQWNFFHEMPGGPHGFGMGEANAPRLGVQLMELPDQLKEYFEVTSGVLVTEVIEESAAAEAGFKAGDVITSVGGEETENPQEVREQLGQVENGPVEIQVMRHGEKQTLTPELSLPKRSRMSGAFHAPSAPMFNIPEMGYDQQALKSQLDELKEELAQLRKELADMRDSSR